MPTVMQQLRRRVVHERRTAWTYQLREPSFTYKSLEMRRVRARMRELGTKDPAYLVDAKNDAHAWAATLGFRTPRLHAVAPSVDAIEWDAVGETVVLKPARATIGAGVHLLRREGSGWRDMASGRSLSTTDIVGNCRALERDGVVSPEIVLEEMVVDPRSPDGPPRDYKVSTFYGAVGMIEVKRRPPDGSGRSFWKVFGADWQSLRNPFNDYETDESMEPPEHAEAMLELTCGISKAVPRAYLRVDLFEDAEGPLLGELTPEPGGLVEVRRDVDRRLGALWEDAEARLRVRFAQDGVLTPAGLTPDASRLVVRRDG